MFETRSDTGNTADASNWAQGGDVARWTAAPLAGLDHRGDLLWANDATVVLLGAERALLVGVNLAHILNLDEPDQKRLERTLNGDLDGCLIDLDWTCNGLSRRLRMVISQMGSETDLGAIVSMTDVSDLVSRAVGPADAMLYQVCFDSLEQGLLLVDLQGEILLSNPAAETIMGMEPAEFGRRLNVGELRVTDEYGHEVDFMDRPVVKAVVQRAPQIEKVIYVEGENFLRVLRMNVQPIIDDDGEVDTLVVAFVDVTNERRLEQSEHRAAEEANSTRRLLETLLSHTTDLILVTDMKGRLIYRNAAAFRVLGHDLLPGDSLNMNRIHPDDLPAVKDTLKELVEHPGSTRKVEFRTMDDSSNEWRHLEVMATNKISDPAVGGVVSSVRDITERTQSAEQLSWQAFHDGLTGLANRRRFTDQLITDVATAREKDETAAIFYIDLDRFKLINDERGHDAGDRLLVEIASRLGRVLDAGDIPARFGGDEFVVLARADSETDILTKAEAVRYALSSISSLDGEAIDSSVSLGVAFVGRYERDVQRVIGDADAALYKAKQMGRNRVEVFSRALRVAAERRAQVESNLRRVLRDREIRMHHQPIVSLVDGKVVGTEALARVPLPDGRLDLPSEYVQVANDRGLVTDFGDEVLRAVGSNALAWHGASGGDDAPFVTVNVSSRQLANRDFVRRVGAMLDRYGLPASDVILEFTEDTLIEADQTTASTISSLDDMGIKMWLDDFGTGYSSLAYLKRFPIDGVKLDRTFVQGLGESHSDNEIVRAVLAMADALGLLVVAEGIEKGVQLEALRSLGCPLAQGFLVGRPCPAEELDMSPRNLNKLEAEDAL